jgi:hypothetical protein
VFVFARAESETPAPIPLNNMSRAACRSGHHRVKPRLAVRLSSLFALSIRVIGGCALRWEGGRNMVNAESRPAREPLRDDYFSMAVHEPVKI